MNANITKEIAISLALKLTEKKRVAFKEADKKLAAFIEDVAKRKVPKEVAIAYEKYPSYISTKSRFTVTGAGIPRYDYVSIHNEVPAQSSDLELTKEQANQYIKLKNQKENAEKTYKDLQRSVENSLLQCKTYNRVKELFPEAYVLLPPKYPPPALNFSDLRKKLK